MNRTNYSSEIDAALAGRNIGSKGYWECARSGNGNMMTDLMSEDTDHYEELEGLGESVEEMDASESSAEDNGRKDAFKPFREARADEQPPYAPKPGKGWMRRRIRMESRRPGGNRLTRVRWVLVSPEKYDELMKAGKIKTTSQGPMLGFFDISASNMTFLAAGGALVGGLMYLMKRRRAS